MNNASSPARRTSDVLQAKTALDGGVAEPGVDTAPNGRPTASERLIRLPEVLSRTGLSRSTLYAKIVAGAFPAQQKLGLRIVAWYESEIAAWIADPR